VSGSRAPQTRRGVLAWAARHSGRLALGALLLAASHTCREYDSAGQYTLRTVGPRSARVTGPARGHRNPLFSSTSHDFYLRLDLPPASPAGSGAGTLIFVSPSRPKAGTYALRNWTDGGRTPDTIGVLLTSAARREVPDPEDEEWRTLGGTVRVSRARWWADGLTGTFDVRFARRAAARVDTIAVVGSFRTR
jgi:hypothetical protein